MSEADLFSSTMSHLDGLCALELLNVFKKALAANRGVFSQQLAERLDTLFVVKCTRLLRIPYARAEHLGVLEDVMARIGHDQYRELLDSYEPRYYARWEGMRAMLFMAISFAEKINEKRSTIPKDDDAWMFVACRVAARHADGVPWAELVSECIHSGKGLEDKREVSGLLNAMRSAGWIAVAEGFSEAMYVYPGPQLPYSRTTTARIEIIHSKQ